MNKDEKKQFAGIMAGMAEVFNAQVSEMGLHLRFKALEGYTIDQVETAAMELIQSHKYSAMPTPADMIDRIERAKKHNRELFIKSRKEMPTTYLKMEADRGCSVCADVMNKRLRSHLTVVQ